MVPILGGEPLVDWYPPSKDAVLDYDILDEHALWNIFRKYGFISTIGFDNCDYGFPEALGRRPKVEHVVRTFYCAAFTWLKIHAKKDSTT